MARYSPEFIAAVRHDYENTDKSLAQIAADHAISERSVNRMRDRERWARRSERVRDVAPATQALRAATRLLASTAASTTLADLLTPLLAANPFSTMRASLRRRSSDEFEDGVAHGWQGRLRRGPVYSFFSALLLRGGDAGERRKQSSS